MINRRVLPVILVLVLVLRPQGLFGGLKPATEVS